VWGWVVRKVQVQEQGADAGVQTNVSSVCVVHLS
jgi:hypothetical protein